MDWFCAGDLCHDALRHVIVGRAAFAVPAQLSGYSVAPAAVGRWSVIAPGAGTEGLLVSGVSEAEFARLDYYFAVYGQKPVTVMPDGGSTARAYAGLGSGAWDQADWLARDAETAVAAARVIMAMRNEVPAPDIAARLGAVLVRESSRVRAGQSAPAELRYVSEQSDVMVAKHRQPYAEFFAVEEYDVSWRRFDGAMSPTVTRAVFVSGDAVTVLPYDPVRDRVLVVEQFRAGPLARGDAQCWQIEAIAGRIDPGETPEEAARREAVEEANLRLDRLIEVSRYYPSTGGISEYIYSYVALTDLPDGSAGVFGVEGEAEDIRGHLISFDRMMELVASGEIENAPLIVTALWLQRERARLRGL